jgi:hypothetical protein
MKLMPDEDSTSLAEKMIDKLEWLTDYALDIVKWNEMLLLTRSVETHLKQSGISDQSPIYFEQNLAVYSDSYLQDFQQHILDYVIIQSNKFKELDTYLATSDVIESLFGKYKQFSSRCPLKEIGQTILTICLSTMNLTTNIIKNALETTTFVDVEDWKTEVFGLSMLSKRKTLFSLERASAPQGGREDTKTA